MARILWITSQVPDLHLGGGNIRQAHLLAATASQHEVHLALVGHLRDDHLRQSLAGLVEFPAPPARPPAHGLTRTAHHIRAFVQRQPEDCVSQAVARSLLRSVVANEREYEIVCVEHLALAPLIPSERRARWTIDLHHLPSIQAEQLRTVSTGVARRWFWAGEARKARRMERWVVASYDRTFVCSGDDATHLDATVDIVPNGAELGSDEHVPLPGRPVLVFAGSLDYRPNIDGARWLCDAVMPLVHAERPDAVLQIVGHRPTQEIGDLARRTGVEVHADVPSVEPFLLGARVAVVPLRLGSGTRLKALEAMAARRPLVGTTIGLQGLDLVDGVHARIADDPSTFAQAIVELLDRDDLSRQLALAARGIVEERFCWTRIGRDFSARLSSLAAAPAGN